MELVISSVWQHSENQLQKMRVIALLPDTEEVVLYSLAVDRKKISKPFIEPIEDFTKKISDGQIEQGQFCLPPIMLLSDDALTKESIDTRNKRYQLIKDLIDKECFLLDFSMKRSKLVVEHANNLSTTVSTIYRILKDYFRYGMTINALIPLRDNQGGAGKEKAYSDAKRGRPVIPPKFGFAFDPGINITEDYKDRIAKGYNEFFANKKELSLSQAYTDTLIKYFPYETLKSKPVPTFGQFKYWGNISVDKVKVNTSRKPKGDFERNQRGLSKSVQASANIPGKVFEIDSTPADVFIVSSLNRNICIGKPTIYSITDRASRMIVGFYICLESPSWEAARLAILHAFTSKVEYAKEYGVVISEEDWPCYHTPETLMGDRGELKGTIPGNLIPTIGTSLELAPAYRPDMKSIVEGRFRLINKESLHELPGTTKGRLRQRVEGDPRQDAVLTRKELTAILIRDVITHNNFHTFDDILTQDMVRADLTATPQNFWNFHINSHRHCLRIKSDVELKALLLPTVKAKVTRYGIKYNDIYYTCNLAEIENWYSLARTGKEWEVDAKFDENCMWEIFIKPNRYTEFIVCKISKRSSFYSGIFYDDIAYLDEWKNFHKKNSKRTKAELEKFEAREHIINNAHTEQNALAKPKFKSDKIKNIKANKREEIALLKRREIKSADQADGNVVNFPTPMEFVDRSVRADTSLFKNLWEIQSDD